MVIVSGLATRGRRRKEGGDTDARARLISDREKKRRERRGLAWAGALLPFCWARGKKWAGEGELAGFAFPFFSFVCFFSFI